MQIQIYTEQSSHLSLLGVSPHTQSQKDPATLFYLPSTYRTSFSFLSQKKKKTFYTEKNFELITESKLPSSNLVQLPFVVSHFKRFLHFLFCLPSNSNFRTYDATTNKMKPHSLVITFPQLEEHTTKCFKDCLSLELSVQQIKFLLVLDFAGTGAYVFRIFFLPMKVVRNNLGKNRCRIW